MGGYIGNVSNDVLLTGVARSGTTLACELLNDLPDIVVLDEPFDNRSVAALRDQDFLAWMARFMAHTRCTIMQDRRAASLQNSQRISQHYLRARGPDGLRARNVERGTIQVEKNLTGNFTLVVKHFMPILINLRSLTTRFRVYALVRQPVAVLASMSTLSTLRDGYYQHHAEYIPNVIRTVLNTDDRIQRLIIVLMQYFELCRPLLDVDAVIRYEDVIASGGNALKVIVPEAMTLDRKLENYNNNETYGIEQVVELGRRLLREATGAIWDFYPRSSVEQFIEESQPLKH